MPPPCPPHEWGGFFIGQSGVGRILERRGESPKATGDVPPQIKRKRRPSRTLQFPPGRIWSAGGKSPKATGGCPPTNQTQATSQSHAPNPAGPDLERVTGIEPV
jgi:hypothetical protein